MKRLLLFLSTLVMGVMLKAQAPQSFSYQAVVRNAAGQALAEQTVGVRLSLRQGNANGSEVYAELHTVTTNVAGLITLAVGEGAVQTQTTLADIDWTNGPWYLCTAVDPTGGTNYVLNTVQQLHAVPYALHATDAEARAQVAALKGKADSLQVANEAAMAALDAKADSLHTVNEAAVENVAAMADSLYSVSAYGIEANAAAISALTAENDSLKVANSALQAELVALGIRMQQYVDSVIAAALQSIGGSDTNNGAETPVPEGYVDLGLPSGLLWATCNLGATSPEEYGDYYAWGETTTKSVYDWSTYLYCTVEGDDWLNTLTKYNTSTEYGTVDNLTTLLAEDDAATQVLGSGARLPTQAEWEELIDNTTVEWTTMNGVYGRKFTAANGNTLFLPIAGYRSDGWLNNSGSHGYYWSASLHESYPCFAWNFYFGLNYQNVGFTYRYYGLSVRAVRASEN